MQLKTVPKDFIINVSYSQFEKTESNFLLHGLSIKNNSKKEINLRKISFEMYSLNEHVKEVS